MFARSLITNSQAFQRSALSQGKASYDDPGIASNPRQIGIPWDTQGGGGPRYARLIAGIARDRQNRPESDTPNPGLVWA